MINITFYCTSNNQKNQYALIKNLERTSRYPENIEIIFLLDDGDESCKENLLSLNENSPLKIKYQFNKRSKYNLLNLCIDDLFPIASKSSNFHNQISDKVRFKTMNWDKKLENYKNLYEDNIFRVCISKYKNINYYRLKEAITIPENFPFVTRRWLEVSGGWGEFSDASSQAVQFYLGKLKRTGLFRSIPALDIEIEEYQHSGVENNNLSNYHNVRIFIVKKFFLKPEAILLKNYSRQVFFRRAIKLALYIDNYSKIKKEFKFIEDYESRIIKIVDLKKNLIGSACYNLPIEEKFFSFSEYISETIQVYGGEHKGRNFLSNFLNFILSIILILKNFIFVFLPIKKLENIKLNKGLNGNIDIEHDKFLVSSILNVSKKAYNQIKNNEI
jgi:hypothetical protein